MAKTAGNVILSPSRTIPFAKFVPSQSTVRRIKVDMHTDGTRLQALTPLVTPRLKLAAAAPALLYRPCGYSPGIGQQPRDQAPVTDGEDAGHARLCAECQALDKGHEGRDELPGETDANLGTPDVVTDQLQAQPLVFAREEIARAGAFVALDCLRGLSVQRGFAPSMNEAGQDAHVHRGGQAADGQGAELSDASMMDGIGPGTLFSSACQAPGATVLKDENGCCLKPMPEMLVMELTAQLPDHHKMGEMATEAKNLPRCRSRQDLAGKGRGRPGLPCPIRPKATTFATSSLAT